MASRALASPRKQYGFPTDIESAGRESGEAVIAPLIPELPPQL